MESLFLVLISIFSLFFIFLILKSVLKKNKFCPICLGVSISWIFLLLLYFLGLFDDKLLIAILMGSSITGIFYLVEKFGNFWEFFKLPIFITLIFSAYFVLTDFNFYFNSIIFILGVWLFFSVVYLYRKNKNVKKFVDKVVECCKKW